MGFLDSLIGRTQLPKTQEDKIFAITTAAITLEAAGGLEPCRRVGAVFRRLQPGRFTQSNDELHKLLDVEGKAGAFTIEDSTDQYGFQWLVVSGEDFQMMVAALHAVAQSLIDDGYGDLLLAAAFRFQQKDRPVYWVYEYKRGAFYPFAPAGGEQQRDNERELVLKAQIGKELPVELEMSRWFPLWGIPI